MRSAADRRLTEPYRSWIDRAAPLPPDVQLLPRTVNAGLDALTFLALALPMWAVGAFLFGLASRIRPDTDGWPPLLFLGAVVAALGIVPLIVLRRAYRTIRAAADEKRGVLRQGVLIGPGGMLVRMEPNRCYPIPTDRFVVARLLGPERSKATRRPTIEIETMDGTLELFADRLGAHPERINQAVSALWPSWSRPKPPLRRNRKRREDRSRTRSLNVSIALFLGSVAFALAIFTALALDDSLRADPVASAIAKGALLLVPVSALYVTGRFLTRKVFYRCPQCRARPLKVPETFPAIHYYCPACNVEWDTGQSERHADMD